MRSRFTRCFVLFCGLSSTVYAQQFERVVVDSSAAAAGYYMALQPGSGHVQGVMVLMPGFGDPPEAVFASSKLQNVAWTNDILTIAVSGGQNLLLTDNLQRQLNAVMKDVIKRYRVAPERFVIGGFSAGGTLALRYTELCKERPADFPIQPRAVFSVDGPVDIPDLVRRFDRFIKRDFSPRSTNEAKSVKKMMANQLGELPANMPRYVAASPFYTAADTPGNEHFLQQVAVRSYHDLDMPWQLKERRNSLSDLNAAAASEMISRLLQQGNEEAEFIQTQHAGYNLDGTRNPHSWSIVDERELVQWVRRKLRFLPENVPGNYLLGEPAGWSVERMKFPIEFAPSINYQGYEDLRFLPGWGNQQSEEYWSYCFLWWLEEQPQLDKTTLESYLKAYYEGLVDRNIGRRQIPADKIVPVKVQLTPAKITPGDAQTFNGDIDMLDYMGVQPIRLHVILHIKDCTVPQRKALFVELSPRPAGHTVWRQMDSLWKSFECGK
ncbi:hypothetical protein [Chitinophaga qingshengii]|uniref:Alpha/beta hydrolase n=1 Tax=Chitinophaga qingshengii TaxID=1569794 RepID=A0ABR7TRN6_9BACT|nr:hypothetical protein [Chitinophaga qingshengii]MBC9933155.1 hypothetical protein [Chitinophaga qingshengii]